MDPYASQPPQQPPYPGPYQQQPYQGRPRDPRMQNQQSGVVLQFTPEELRTLKECQQNAIVRRGLPFSLAALGGCHLLIQKGFFKKRPLSYVLCGVSGLLMGTTSYRHICIDKIMALPNSTLKERILAAQGKQPVRVEVDGGENSSFFDNVLPSENPPMSSSLDIEPYQWRQSDEYSASAVPIDTDAAYAVDPPLQPAQRESYTTYDELRRKNRETYDASNPNRRPYRSGPPPTSSSYTPPPPSYAPTSPSYSTQFQDSTPTSFDRPNDTHMEAPRRDDFL